MLQSIHCHTFGPRTVTNLELTLGGYVRVVLTVVRKEYLKLPYVLM
jgi:hypothetical protein